MKSFETTHAIVSDESSLKQLTNQIVNAYQPIANKQNSHFVNNVPDFLKLRIDEDALAALIGSVFYTMASCSRDSFIEVSAEYYANVILLHVKDTNTFNSYAIRSKLQHLQQMAEKLGGVLTISSERPKETSITFSFTNSDTIHLQQDRMISPVVASTLKYA